MVVLLAAVPIILVSLKFERKYLLISRKVQDQQGDLATRIEESALGFRVIKAFGRRGHVQGQFDDEAITLYDTSVEKVRLASRFWSFLGVIPNLTLVIVLLLGALAVGREAITLGTLVAFITLMLSLIWPVTSLGAILAMAQEAMTAADRISEILDTHSVIQSGPEELVNSRGHLRFEHVGFRFSPDSPEILHDINLDLTPGTTLALVGATGSGKTTLTALVPRLYDVTAGRITIDGHDLRDLSLTSLRTAVASAFDDPTLFSMSVRENLTLGRPDASEADVQQALQVAQAEFANDLPWGLETRVGEQGMSLSGGQRQRLALARAVLAKPAVLVLDDTLSALDVHTEALVEEALRNVLAEHHRHRGRAPRVDRDAGRPGGPAAERHDHPRRYPSRVARGSSGVPATARGRGRGGARMTYDPADTSSEEKTRDQTSRRPRSSRGGESSRTTPTGSCRGQRPSG